MDRILGSRASTPKGKSKCTCKQRILIVDDNVFNLQPIKHLIEILKINPLLLENVRSSTSSRAAAQAAYYFSDEHKSNSSNNLANF